MKALLFSTSWSILFYDEFEGVVGEGDVLINVRVAFWLSTRIWLHLLLMTLCPIFMLCSC